MPKKNTRIVLGFVAENPGCSKLDAGNAAWHRRYGRMSYRYAPVNRCIEAGLIRAQPGHGNRYALHLTDEGAQRTSNRSDDGES